jgi:hypothetical protein
MNTILSLTAYKDRTLVIKVIGWLLLLSGITVGMLAPLEMYCFYLFSDGGRFHYEGFGFGSFMYANIAAQIVGYYLIAMVLILLGIGHLKIKRWVRIISLALLWTWLFVGAPLLALVYFILLGTKELSVMVALMALVFFALSYLLFPWLLIRFYQGRNIRQTFESKDTRSYWIENRPMPILVLSLLYIFYIIMLHLLIMLNGIYPLYGNFLFGFRGIIALDVSIACLVGILYGTMQKRLWAWWAAVVGIGLFTCSTVITFLKSNYAALLTGLAFPARELEFLDGVPLQGVHFAIMISVPLLATFGLVLLSKRYFQPDI